MGTAVGWVTGMFGKWQLEADLQQWKSQMAKPAWPSKPQRRKVPIDGMTYELNI